MYTQPTGTTHPSYQIVAAMLSEKTSLNMKARVSASFDMRGMPVLVEDAVRGIHSPETYASPFLRVTAKHLSKLDWKMPETPVLVGSHTMENPTGTAWSSRSSSRRQPT